ncbi:hypothetical protein CP970_25280 [Streptomyces kanamyceticus]|uniref:Uncharacterized protein n=1 Tax=Streptomyces kanamyceticus TaxID=1967 RepID=A0A5J6GF85_STRKN|nr:hypothetical protein CP970_25280 [Streptomyces kanamyceticus]
MELNTLTRSVAEVARMRAAYPGSVCKVTRKQDGKRINGYVPAQCANPYGTDPASRRASPH